MLPSVPVFSHQLLLLSIVLASIVVSIVEVKKCHVQSNLREDVVPFHIAPQTLAQHSGKYRSQVRENMCTLQIAAEKYRQKSGAYANDIESMAPFFPGGEEVLAGTSGEYPANPCSKSRPGIILGDITCESELMFKRLDRPRGFPDRSGQVSYSFDRFRGYAIVGYDKDGMEISTAQGAVEVLSNTWSSDVIFYKGLPVNDAVVYELMKYVERAVIIFKKRHGRLPKKASEIREILPTHLKEKFEQLNVSLSEGEFGIDDAMPIVMQRNTIQYFSPNEGVYGVYAIRGAGANGKPLVHLDRVIVLPETLGLSSM